jgi:hypothetical protein
MALEQVLDGGAVTAFYHPCNYDIAWQNCKNVSAAE